MPSLLLGALGAVGQGISEHVKQAQQEAAQEKLLAIQKQNDMDKLARIQEFQEKNSATAEQRQIAAEQRSITNANTMAENEQRIKHNYADQNARDEANAAKTKALTEYSPEVSQAKAKAAALLANATNVTPEMNKYQEAQLKEFNSPGAISARQAAYDQEELKTKAAKLALDQATITAKMNPTVQSALATMAAERKENIAAMSKQDIDPAIFAHYQKRNEYLSNQINALYKQHLPPEDAKIMQEAEDKANASDQANVDILSGKSSAKEPEINQKKPTAIIGENAKTQKQIDDEMVSQGKADRVKVPHHSRGSTTYSIEVRKRVHRGGTMVPDVDTSAGEEIVK